MANAIQFEPKKVDPKMELQRRLDAAPLQHAEALLVAYELLEEAHKQGILDALHGAVGARDMIVGLIAEYSAQEISVNAIRNVLALGKILGTVDPELLSKLSKHMADAMTEHREEPAPPGWWELFRRVRGPEARRGISLLTHVLTALGRATK